MARPIFKYRRVLIVWLLLTMIDDLLARAPVNIDDELGRHSSRAGE